MNRSFEISVGKGRTRVHATALPMNYGVVICICGGISHIGAVAIAVPCSSLDRDKKGTRVTSSVYTLVGHKDDIIARSAAETVARKLNQVTTVTVGIHVDNATREEIRALISNSDRCVARLLKRLSTSAYGNVS